MVSGRHKLSPLARVEFISARYFHRDDEDAALNILMSLCRGLRRRNPRNVVNRNGHIKC